MSPNKAYIPSSTCLGRDMRPKCVSSPTISVLTRVNISLRSSSTWRLSVSLSVWKCVEIVAVRSCNCEMSGMCCTVELIVTYNSCSDNLWGISRSRPCSMSLLISSRTSLIEIDLISSRNCSPSSVERTAGLKYESPALM